MHQKRLLMTLATGNPHKVSELTALLQIHQQPEEPVQIELCLPDEAALSFLATVPEDGDTFIENARQKALAVRPVSGSAYVLAEDSGLVIPALSGMSGLAAFPGVRSNRWLTTELRKSLLAIDSDSAITQSDRNQAILKLMANHTDRQAMYCCGMVLVSNKPVFEAQGEMRLTVIPANESPKGTGGFGYDPIMKPVDDHRTVAELSAEEKNRLSHRYQAFLQTIHWLKNNA